MGAAFGRYAIKPRTPSSVPTSSGEMWRKLTVMLEARRFENTGIGRFRRLARIAHARPEGFLPLRVHHAMPETQSPETIRRLVPMKAPSVAGSLGNPSPALNIKTAAE
jgi:hypothetical protein